ncbi:hypothetical protein CUMW_174130 [Citrus unshiu]|uniref:non-specific serine/threonine protein kinase n=1 Tax=Citrus unshiu TaxID=55188 RepID=A0A2H5PWN2_CITUN|nr:hypothetical protein CUMW_174130 [Citrus unshiu]
MACKTMILFLLLLFCLPLNLHCTSSTSWIKGGYWTSRSELPVSQINSGLFTHLTCAFAYLNSSTFTLYINSTYEKSFSSFTNTVKRKNPSVVTLLSIRGGTAIFSSMVNQSSNRKSFIESSIETARLYGFQGLDLSGVLPSKSTNMTNLGILFDEWRAEVTSEARNSGNSQLLLVMKSHHLPAIDSVTYPIDSMLRNLDWVHVRAYDYYLPSRDNFTGAHSALYSSSSWFNTNDSIREWLKTGFQAKKLVLGLPYHGYAWQLVNPNENAVGAPAAGRAITMDGSMGYKSIKAFIRDYGYGVASLYNDSYDVNFFSSGKNWINFDGAEAITAKVSFAKEKGLLGYNAFQLSNDDKWELSLAGLVVTARRSISKLKHKISTIENLNYDANSLRVFTFTAIQEATDNFSSENKLGEGGYGPVYKGRLPNGQEMAVKRLSRTSHQGLEEFENEVKLTARLQHVNLLPVLGICTQREEKMLIYDYMPNKSLDFYIFDLRRRYLLDWRKRVHIIEGITQGLLYLQEYSNLTIVHRDLKASNILLDHEMNPKISDFGMARAFTKDECEANTGRIVGTYGYVPPEYVRKGIYSMKYDVYSYGVLLLQILGGKRTSCYYGPNESLNLLEYAYGLWKNGEGMEFIDSSLDDSSSAWKLMRCMQVALLCVQENAADRPTMLEILVMLKSETADIKTPKKPAFSVKKDNDEISECMLEANIYSVDDATITQPIALRPLRSLNPLEESGTIRQLAYIFPQGKSQLLLVMTSHHLPALESVSYPLDSMQRNLDWIHVLNFDYYLPTRDNFTAKKLVLGLPYHGYAWTLVNPDENPVGSPATGPAITIDGSVGYKFIKGFIRDYGYGAASVYNHSYVMNFFSAKTTWVNFDGVETIRSKVSFAKEKGLLGYHAFQLSNDDKWELYSAAQEVGNDQKNSPRMLGILAKGQEIAVKRLSKTSQQGLQEFENEVKLTARLQHVNLVPVVGIYPHRRHLLDWRQRVHIIEGVTQALLYVQEYSNFTIVRRDLKASNILLDKEMKPKISDFGMARAFTKDACEANTGRIVGTYYGVLPLQIISGKRTSRYYGPNEDLNLLEFAYELWKNEEGTEFFDPSLDDSSSAWKLMRCMQIALLCVQENAADRPAVLEILTMLNNETANIKVPRKPAFSVKSDEDECIPELEFSDAQTWIKAGYWLAGREFPLSDINSALFTHLICAFAEVDSSTYQLSISSANQQYFSIFANSVRRKNPSIKTLLSIWNGQNSTYQSILGNKNINPSVLSSMVGDSSHRKSFIESSIRTARLYGFQGIDLFWLWPNSTDLNSLGILLDEWKASASDQPELTLSMAVRYSPTHETVSYPIDSMKKNLNWAHLVAYDYHMPSKENVTGIHAALYNPSSNISTDFGIREWLRRGFPANKLVLGLPFHGYAWTLVNPNDNNVGARASGPGITIDGSMGYKFIRAYIQNYGYGAAPVYNASYVVNLFTSGATWINFDGVETIKAKISYAKEKNLLGYKAFQLSNDDNWALSRAAQIEENNDNDKQRLLLLILLPIALVLILIASLICYFRRTAIKSKVMIILGRRNLRTPGTSTQAAEYFDSDAPNLQVFSFSDIKAATNNFSSANKLGEGGFGPVYKGKLPRGQEFAVKRLSATSTQGLEEFKNEVSLTARLQHVNLLRVLGYCTERDENMLIYEYLPNKSLDLYLFDPIRRYVLDWQKRVNIIEGVTQGLLYLQEYSNFRVIHRDLKASNILLDNELNPKISDFGMAKLFRKDVDEANTGRIVGTYGYVPPEYAFEQWKDSKGKEFIDPSLDDSSSPCKLLNCMQVALLCVQENPEDRPSMLEVSSMLKDDSMAIAAPKRPAFSAKGDENAETSSTSRQEIYSFNDPELSQLEPR